MDGAVLPLDAAGAERRSEAILPTIDSPQDLRRLPRESLPRVAEEIRQALFDTLERTGGHLGSNLGVVELTIALHYAFDFRKDRLVWDVGHQTYPHKLLTGRRARFGTLRQKGGLSGFQCAQESPYDLFTTGHAGTSISLALGLRVGADLLREDRKVVAVIGDASLGCGVAFEALNAAGTHKRDLLVVLNDNEWSIAKTVGALSEYLTRVRTGPLYTVAKRELEKWLERMGRLGDKVEQALGDFAQLARHVIVPGHVFEALGIKYYGPVDGHDVLGVLDMLERVKRIDGIVLLHVLTQKGRGGEGAETDPQRLHGVTPKPKPAVGEDPTKVAPAKVRPKRSFTQAFSDAMLELAARDPRVVAITAAMPDGTGLRPFAQNYPERFFDTGITEQHAVAFAAALARSGMRPVAAIYSTFLQRGLDQVFQEVLVSEAPVVLALDRAGLVGEDGPTHNGLFDVAFLRTYPRMTLLAPRDETELRMMLGWAVESGKIVAMRYPRASCPDPEVGPTPRAPIELGRSERLREGRDAAVFSYGVMAGTALQAAEALAARGIDLEVVNARFGKPLDGAVLDAAFARFPRVFTIEDHADAGGFGSAVLERLGESAGARARLHRFAVPDAFVEHASREDQLRGVGLDAAFVAQEIERRLRG
ncbi:MAG TPA: 1-deoxy-D-xylulose-5-phosphate synthase [Planctomycetota bacterium]|jgi:1-deoxy-D-xylulose-5-phosphate synthase|nr:1-deoxy-D-xylulose-5-phosphate synthase [Planctomycetota bacterium]